MINRIFKQSTKAGMICFLLLMIYYIILNLQIPCMRSLPDEMGAVALGAKLAGYQWSYVLTHPTMYYGSANVIFTYPIFALIRDPMIQYQFLLAAGVFMKAATGVVVVKIAMDYYQVTAVRAVLFGMICTLVTPARTSNIDNEHMLIFTCWMVFYLILILSKTDQKKWKVTYTVLLSFFLAYAQFAHTRAIMYIFLLIGVIGVYYIVEKQIILHIPAFIVSFLCFYIIVKKAVAWCTSQLFTSPETQNEIMMNTLESLMITVVDNLKSLVHPVAIRSCADIICGNIWCTGVFCCGTLIYISVFVIKKAGRNLKLFLNGYQTEREDILYYLALFGVAGVLFTIMALSITWKESVVELHEKSEGITRGLFYLRYYGNYFGILMLYFLILWDRCKCFYKRELKITIGIIAGCYIYSLVSYVFPLINAGYTNLDWFGYFAPLSLTGGQWADKRQTVFYFTNATFIATTIFLFMSGRERRKNFVFVLLLVLVYQYSFNVKNWDAQFANSDRYFQAANGVYEMKKNYPEIFDSVDHIYYFSDIYGSQYIVQFMLGKVEVFLRDAYKEEEQALILTDKNIEEIDLDGYQYMIIDENEILYIKGDNLQKTINEQGFALQDCMGK